MRTPKEPSSTLLHRLQAVAPEKAVEEALKARRERDALRDALALKLVEHVRGLHLAEIDILTVRNLGRVPPGLLAEIAEAVVERLRAKPGWTGLIVMEHNAGFERMSDDVARPLYEKLKARYGGTNAQA